MTVETRGYTLPTVIMGTACNDIPTVNTNQSTCPFTSFNAAFADSPAPERQLVVPRGMTLHSLAVKNDGNQAVTVGVLTVQIDDVDTTITVNIPVATEEVTFDLVNRAHINAGQLLSFIYESEAGATNARIQSISILGDLDG